MYIGLNYYGCTDAQALGFWKKNTPRLLKNQDDIAMREITRVKRWPAQCIAYKYGADHYAVEKAGEEMVR